MKNFFKNFRTYSFWVSLSGAVIILINALGRAFGFEIENQIVEDCLMGVAGVLVVLGIVYKKPENENNNEKNAENNEENIEEDENKYSE